VAMKLFDEAIRGGAAVTIMVGPGGERSRVMVSGVKQWASVEDVGGCSPSECFDHWAAGAPVLLSTKKPSEVVFKDGVRVGIVKPRRYAMSGNVDTSTPPWSVKIRGRVYRVFRFGGVMIGGAPRAFKVNQALWVATDCMEGRPTGMDSIRVKFC
jgi:hypothetical protein